MNKHLKYVDLKNIKRNSGSNMLIQEYNARQAIEESGQEVVEFKLNHSLPNIVFNGQEYELLYSNKHIDRCAKLWNEKRPINVLYRVNSNGVERIVKALSWQVKNPQTKLDVQIITYDTRKDVSIKFFDDDYLSSLSKSKFYLVPDALNRQGDYMVWTYRFIDAVFCGAIPVVETPCELYDGFEYFLMSDTLPEYDPQIPIRNLKMARKKFTIQK